MATTRVTPDEAAKLLEQGWKYIDVRSIPEFEGGHPAGAYNVPINHRGPSGMSPNPDFLEVMEASFSKTQDRLVLGCRSGQRSLRAAEVLSAAGFEHVVDMRGGFEGERDAKGNVSCAGWQARALPVALQAETGRTWSELKETAK
jgi:rhodanese-related sulfurtransferase